jgi:hypothetical protein
VGSSKVKKVMWEEDEKSKKLSANATEPAS